MTVQAQGSTSLLLLKEVSLHVVVTLEAVDRPFLLQDPYQFQEPTTSQSESNVHLTAMPLLLMNLLSYLR